MTVKNGKLHQEYLRASYIDKIMFDRLVLHVNQLCLIHNNTLFFLLFLRFVHLDLTVLRKVRNVEAFLLAEWILPTFSSLDHGGCRNDPLRIEIEQIITGIRVN